VEASGVCGRGIDGFTTQPTRILEGAAFGKVPSEQASGKLCYLEVKLGIVVVALV
jgi:hypothetical protein